MKKSVLIAILLLLSCGKDKPRIPEAALLDFPAQNSVCVTGAEVTSTTSRVIFNWLAAKNTDTYKIEATNLETNATQVATTSGTSQGIVLEKGAPYSWFVISKNKDSQEEARSQTWLFYNAGSQLTYAPFPAQIDFPISGSTVIQDENGELILRWTGSDVDDDIASFEVFLDTVDPPAVSLGILSSSVQELVVSLNPSTIYYWRIITTDEEGNTSDSGIFSFRTR